MGSPSREPNGARNGGTPPYDSKEGGGHAAGSNLLSGFVLGPLMNPGVGHIGHLGRQRQILASKRIGLLPLLAVLVNAADLHVVPESAALYRRVALGTFGVSSAAARISGNLTDEPVDFDADGFVDFLRVQFWVTAQQAGTYLASGLVVDETGGSSIAGSETALELPIGTSTVSVLFDCRKLAVPGTYGPFSLQNLELFERRDDHIASVDRYREAYTLATAQIEVPCPPFDAPDWGFDGDCDGDRDLRDVAAFQRCFSPGLPVKAGCERFNRSGVEGVDRADFAGLRDALTGPMPPPVP